MTACKSRAALSVTCIMGAEHVMCASMLCCGVYCGVCCGVALVNPDAHQQVCRETPETGKIAVTSYQRGGSRMEKGMCDALDRDVASQRWPMLRFKSFE